MYKCRYCKSEVRTLFADLGLQPLSNDYIGEGKVNKGQYVLPLKVAVCEKCKLVQVLDYQAPDNIFNEEYKYFSSFSTSWLKHCENYVDMIVKRLNLDKQSSVLEIASNDGYLLQFFLKYEIEPTGVEPSKSVADVATRKGIHTITDFFGTKFAEKYNQKVDLVIGNNVLAHVPDIGDFVKGLKIILNDEGTITLEFPHLLNLINKNEFDTIYHEHFSYLSIIAIKRIFEDNGLKIYDVEKLDTHGGSLRIYVTHIENEKIIESDNLKVILNEELEFGLDKINVYEEFAEKIKKIKYSILEKLIQIKREGKSIIGYGAAAKGNTLFNYCGIGKEFIDFVVDANPNKQGHLLPGSLIPVLPPDEIKKKKPDYIIIIPWNLENEIKETLAYTREWGSKLLVLIPSIREVN